MRKKETFSIFGYMKILYYIFKREMEINIMDGRLNNTHTHVNK